MSRAGLAGLACLSLIATASRAADWDGSYAADGRCYCSGTLSPTLSSRIVPTPLGGQSVAKVCARIGGGPGLSEVDGRFDRVVYTDAQCGHGPGAVSASMAGGDELADECSGTMEPGGDDCRATGPRWDLASAYARQRHQAVEASVAQIGASIMGAPAVVPALGAAASERATTRPDADVNIVEIGGRRWREAPAGTPETGEPGSRIVLDDKVFLDVELATEEDFRPRSVKGPAKAPRAAAARPKPAAAARAPVATPAPSAETLAALRARLLTEARERLRERAAEAKARSADTADSPSSASIDRKRSEGSPTLGAAREASPAPVADTPVPAARAGSTTDDEITIRDRSTRDEDAVEQSAGMITEGDADEVLSPFMQALRMPAGARPSSREFGYVDAMPASWKYGGGGLMLEGSAAVRERFRALVRVGAATDYQELLLGGSWYTTPERAERLTLVLTAGVETGRFELDGVRGGQRVGTDLSDTGLYLGAASRFVVSRRFELQAGVGYSTFFDGDPTLFGGGYFHVGRQLDVVSRVEIGDNDSLGIGVRYYY